MKVGYAKDQWFMLLTNSLYSFFTHPEVLMFSFQEKCILYFSLKHAKFPKISHLY